ncbi:MAG: hypothetical protein EOP45_18660 [Sphingobacteriaceae bacterium]|nr:MAG: hypothetical protein EOP45_18660 [Sphingobacteriaceae bacterium]
MHLCILDANGVLVHKRPKGQLAILRPHVKIFLKQLLHWQKERLCRVAIWTTITERNAEVIVNQLLTPEEQKECLFIWTADQCKSIFNIQ